MLPDDRLQQILANKDVDNAVYEECWSICDGAIIIWHESDPPKWFPKDRDEDGNTPEFVRQHGNQEAQTA